MCLVPEIYAIPVLVVDLSDHNHFIKKDIAFEKIPLIISAPTIEKINKERRREREKDKGKN